MFIPARDPRFKFLVADSNSSKPFISSVTIFNQLIIIVCFCTGYEYFCIHFSVYEYLYVFLHKNNCY